MKPRFYKFWCPDFRIKIPLKASLPESEVPKLVKSRKRVFLGFCLLLLTSCGFVQQSYVALATTNRKQKYKTTLLQKKLAIAEKKLQESQEETDRLRFALCEAELNAIETDLDLLEQKWQVNPELLAASLQAAAPNLFLEERETLHTIMDLDRSSTRAQFLLDRYLQLITQLSDTTHHYSQS